MNAGKREEGVLKQTRTGTTNGCGDKSPVRVCFSTPKTDVVIKVLYGSALAHPRRMW